MKPCHYEIPLNVVAPPWVYFQSRGAEEWRNLPCLADCGVLLPVNERLWLPLLLLSLFCTLYLCQWLPHGPWFSLTSSVCNTHTLTRMLRHIVTVKMDVSQKIKQYANLMNIDLESSVSVCEIVDLQETLCFSFLFWLLANATGTLGLAATS